MFVLSVFLIERVILVVIVCVIDFTIGEIVFRVCLLWFVLGVFLIERLCGLFVVVVLGVFLIERFWIVCCDCLM